MTIPLSLLLLCALPCQTWHTIRYDGYFSDPECLKINCPAERCINATKKFSRVVSVKEPPGEADWQNHHVCVFCHRRLWTETHFPARLEVSDAPPIGKPGKIVWDDGTETATVLGSNWWWVDYIYVDDNGQWHGRKP